MTQHTLPETDIDIIVLTDDIRSKTGFGTNGRLVCWALAEQWNVVNAAINGQERTTADIKGREIDIVPVGSKRDPQTGSPDGLGREGMEKLISVADPNAVVSLIDVQMCEYLGELKEPKRVTVELRDAGGTVDIETAISNLRSAGDRFTGGPEFEWIAQVPIDGEPLPDSWEPFFAEVDHPVAMSEYGATVAEDAFDADMTTIRHGVEFQDVADVEADPFVVGTVNRNQFRKQHPRLIEAWGKFYEKAGRPDDIRFYAHCDYQDDMGWDLNRFIKRWGLEDVILPYRGKVSRTELMQLYNQFDVFASATGGEGFGLTTIEAMSQGTPVVITDYTTSEELVLDGSPAPRGRLIEPAVMYDDHPRFAAVQRALVDTDQFADALLSYYRNTDRLERHGENAREWVHRECNWEDIADEWVTFVETEVLPTGA